MNSGKNRLNNEINAKKKFIESLKEGYINYLKIHSRSSKKIVPMHKCISEILIKKLGKKYEIKSKGIGNNKEFKFNGKYYHKDLDITVLINGKPISALGFKFITSNYKQNSNNYFENMLGETANVRRNNLLYGQLLVFKAEVPYYSSDDKQYKKIEKINEKNLKKYFKLGLDEAKCLYHKPDIMFIAFIKTGDEERIKKAIKDEEPIRDKKEFNKKELLPLVEKNGVSFVDPCSLKESFSQEMLDFLKKHGDFDEFIEAFVNLTKGRSFGR